MMKASLALLVSLLLVAHSLWGVAQAGKHPSAHRRPDGSYGDHPAHEAAAYAASDEGVKQDYVWIHDGFHHYPGDGHDHGGDDDDAAADAGSIDDDDDAFGEDHDGDDDDVFDDEGFFDVEEEEEGEMEGEIDDGEEPEVIVNPANWDYEPLGRGMHLEYDFEQDHESELTEGAFTYHPDELRELEAMEEEHDHEGESEYDFLHCHYCDKNLTHIPEDLAEIAAECTHL